MSQSIISTRTNTSPDTSEKKLEKGNFLVRKDIRDCYSFNFLIVKEIKNEENELVIETVDYDIFERNKCRTKSKIHESELNKYIIYNSVEEFLELFDNKELMKSFNQKEESEQTNSTDLVDFNNKETYIAIKSELDKKLSEAERKKQIIMTQIAYEKTKLEEIRQNMENVLNGIKVQVKRVNEVIEQIELYMGIKEEIVQIAKGEPTPKDTTITLHQEVLYMDEEVGDWKNQGIELSSIEKFDEWVVKNIDLFISEKGIRIFRIRREEKRGGYNYFTGSYNPYMRNTLDPNENGRNYILIRNGENIYRIWTQNQFGNKLFPNKDELQKHIDEESHSNELEKFVNQYKRNLITIQGIIERSNTLMPHNQINIFKNNTEYVEFVYDMDKKRIANYVPFRIWQKTKNQSIEEGSRVIFSEFQCDWSEERVAYAYRNSFDAFKKIEDGIYDVKINTEGNIAISFNPQRYYKRYSTKASHNVLYTINKNDNNVINMDNITIEEIEFYLNNRIDRREYLSMMPILEKARIILIEEKESEKDFATLFKYPEKDVWEAIKWWKTKNKFKRAISKDDTKAYQMIQKHLEKQKENK